MLAEPDRDLGQHVVVGPGRVVAHQPRHLAVEEAGEEAGAVGRGAVAALPEIGEERVGVVGLPLLGEVLVGLRRLLGGGRRLGLGLGHLVARGDPGGARGEPRPGLLGERVDRVDRLLEPVGALVEGPLAGGDLLDQRGSLGGDLGEGRLALLDRGERVALGGVELAGHGAGAELVEPHPGERLVGVRLAGAEPRRLLGGGLKHRGQPVLVAAHAEDGLLELGQRLAGRDHRATIQ